MVHTLPLPPLYPAQLLTSEYSFVFAGPNAVACDQDGYVYVTEDENHRIRVISPTGMCTAAAAAVVVGAVVLIGCCCGCGVVVL